MHRSRWNQVGNKNENDWLKCRSITDLYFFRGLCLIGTLSYRYRSLEVPTICLCQAVSIWMAVSVMLTMRHPSRYLGREVLEPACTLFVCHIPPWVGSVLSCQGVEPTFLELHGTQCGIISRKRSSSLRMC